MKATGIVRNVDTLGRVVIPKEIRSNFNIEINDPIEIYVNDKDEIILKKYEPACIFCNATEDVYIYNGKQICKKCITQLSEALSKMQ